MTTTAEPGYDLATLQQARLAFPLQVHQGIATSYQWVARADDHLNTVIAGDGHIAHNVTDFLNSPGPGHRATMRALLEDAQHYVSQHPELWAVPLSIDNRASTATSVCLTNGDDRVTIYIDRAHCALVGDLDSLVAVRRRPSVYVVVVRRETVMAAIRATLGPGVDVRELRKLLPNVRQYRS